MPFDCRRRDLAILAAFALVVFLYTNLTSLHARRKLWQSAGLKYSPEYEDYYHRQHESNRVAQEDAFAHGPANSTLGFGTIIATSSRNSRRRPGLTRAANLTDLEIVIPEQPKWTDEDIESIKDEKQSIISKGSAMAWLGHMNTLKAFLETNHTTALIIEDDVDWDIHLRHHQVPLVASQLRALLSANPTLPKDQYSKLRSSNRELSYWGDLSQWEVLYLGHCGDNFDLKYWSELPHNIFHDETVPAMDKLHIDTMNWLLDAGIGEHERMIHRSKSPLCTFAYAVNRRSAERMLEELSHEEENHGTWSFDVRLLEACRDLDWKCWTSNPELFHHKDEHESSITEINGKPLFAPHEDAGQGDGTTPNIGCGARSPKFEAAIRDQETMERVKQIAMQPDTCSLAKVS